MAKDDQENDPALDPKLATHDEDGGDDEDHGFGPEMDPEEMMDAAGMFVGEAIINIEVPDGKISIAVPAEMEASAVADLLKVGVDAFWQLRTQIQ